jgi:Tetratricopeptide repeat
MNLGKEHPSVARSLDHLAQTYQAEGFDAEAEALFQRALAIREKMLPPNHPDTAELIEHYAALLEKTGSAARVGAEADGARTLR